MPSRRSRPPRHQKLDHLCKRAMAIDQARILDLVLSQADIAEGLGLLPGPLQLLEQLPTEFQRGDLNADDLLRLSFAGQQVLGHVEYQSRPDAHMPHRVLEYQSAVVIQYDLPIFSVVFDVGGTARKAVALEEHDWLGLRCRFVTVNVAQAVRSWPEHPQSPMALLLRMLMQEASEESLRLGLGELAALGIGGATCRDLLVVLSFLLDRRDGGDGSRHQIIAKELFAMLRLEDSWIYQEGVEKGVEKGHQKGVDEGVETLQETAVRLAESRFGVDELGAGRIRRLRDPQQLSELILRLASAARLADALLGVP